MKVYYYTPEQLNMESFPSGEMRLNKIIAEPTIIPAVADVFAIPAGFHVVPDEVLYNLPHWDKHHARHAILNVSDSYKRFTTHPMMIFRCDTTKAVMEANPWTIPIAWPVEDLRKYHEAPIVYDDGPDVSFVGWVSTRLCKQALHALRRSELHCDFTTYSEFYGYLSKEVQDERRQPFIDSLAMAKTSLCVRSIPAGVIRYRFYEAMSMGRLIIHVNDNAVYPFAERIDYDRFVIKVPEDRIKDIADIVSDRLRQYTMIMDRWRDGVIARAEWLLRLNADDWNMRFAQECEKRIKEL